MEKKTSKFARVMALLGVIILLIAVVATLVVAIIDFEGKEEAFRILLMLDVIIPGVIWGYLIIYRWAKNRDDMFVNTANDTLKAESSNEDEANEDSNS